MTVCYPEKCTNIYRPPLFDWVELQDAFQPKDWPRQGRYNDLGCKIDGIRLMDRSRTCRVACQMKGEGLAPGAVVYTSALAECRWAGESQHERYLLDQLDTEGLEIVPGGERRSWI